MLKGVSASSKDMFWRYQRLAQRPRWPHQLQRARVWSPIFCGSTCIFVLCAISVVWWCNYGESFLSLTRRLPAEVLVVEGWIGPAGIRAAAEEFEQRGYNYVVPTGGLAQERSAQSRSTYAELAERELIRSGVPKDRILVAHASDAEGQHTYQSALAVRQALQAGGIRPKALNVFTLSTHARRSCLVFAKVNEPKTQVGVISWTPSGYKDVPWWLSRERSRCMLKEPACYLFEALFNSGRQSNSAIEGGSTDVVQNPSSGPKTVAP